MGCKKKTMTILKRIGKELKPILVQTAINMVKQVEEMAVADPMFFTNDAKRKIVAAGIVTEAAKGGAKLPGRTVNLLVEFGVEAVKGPDDESDLGLDDRMEPLTETI